MAITHLDRPETLGPAATALGACHSAYSIHPN
jgi:hypothetical protein